MRNNRSVKAEFELADTILREAREELTRADGKSSLLLAAAGVVAGAVVAAVFAGDWSPTSLESWAQVVWWSGSVAGLGSIVSFAFSVYPRTDYRGERAPALIAYYGDVVATPRDQLPARLRATARQDGARSLDQLKIVSDIVDRKFRGIQVGLWLAALSVTVCSSALLSDHFYRLAQALPAS